MNFEKIDRSSRSDHYQYVIAEVLCGEVVWSCFTNQHSLDYLLDPFKYDEQYLELKDQLKEAFWNLAKKVCTERQWLCLTLTAQGLTQTEIANQLGVNQSSITKSLNGNIDYTKIEKKSYGGIIKKLKKLIAKDKKIQNIIQQLSEATTEKL